jgi:hypothetical protein
LQADIEFTEARTTQIQAETIIDLVKRGHYKTSTAIDAVTTNDLNRLFPLKDEPPIDPPVEIA